MQAEENAVGIGRPGVDPSGAQPLIAGQIIGIMHGIVEVRHGGEGLIRGTQCLDGHDRLSFCLALRHVSFPNIAALRR